DIVRHPDTLRMQQAYQDRRVIVIPHHDRGNTQVVDLDRRTDVPVSPDGELASGVSMRGHRLPVSLETLVEAGHVAVEPAGKRDPEVPALDQVIGGFERPL